MEGRVLHGGILSRERHHCSLGWKDNHPYQSWTTVEGKSTYFVGQSKWDTRNEITFDFLMFYGNKMIDVFLWEMLYF